AAPMQCAAHGALAGTPRRGRPGLQAARAWRCAPVAAAPLPRGLCAAAAPGPVRPAGWSRSEALELLRQAAGGSLETHACANVCSWGPRAPRRTGAGGGGGFRGRRGGRVRGVRGPAHGGGLPAGGRARLRPPVHAGRQAGVAAARGGSRGDPPRLRRLRGAGGAQRAAVQRRRRGAAGMLAGRWARPGADGGAGGRCCARVRGAAGAARAAVSAAGRAVPGARRLGGDAGRGAELAALARAAAPGGAAARRTRLWESLEAQALSPGLQELGPGPISELCHALLVAGRADARLQDMQRMLEAIAAPVLSAEDGFLAPGGSCGPVLHRRLLLL
ncbi:unnamed protein product, partial [Prorocentrum cordatum]